MENNALNNQNYKSDKIGHLPKLPFNNIAISLSGGGFRATSIHLGVLSYLSKTVFFNISLLERVRAISTVSAGTIAGVKYTSTLKKGGTFNDCYKSIYTFITDDSLVEDALEYLAYNDNWKGQRQRSLINAFSSMYYQKFESETFGLLWQEKPEIHLKEISFNATEFNFALPFHFQKTEKPSVPREAVFTSEYIGNHKIHIPIEIAKEVRFSDIIAASSCFPFGFEPINFPDDFIYEEAINLKDPTLLPSNVYDGDKIEYPIGLMDGGIDDNQGVDAIITSEARMRKYPDEIKRFRSDDKKAVDLYIVSDGTNPNMASYTRSTKESMPIIGKWNFSLLRHVGITIAVIGLAAIIYACFSSIKVVVILSTIFGTFGLLFALFLLICSMGFVGLTRRMGVPDFFAKRLIHVDKLSFGTLNNLFVNRKKSVMKMVTKVFIKHMRWFSFERIFGDIHWRPRLIMNAVFELTKEEVEKRKKKYPYYSKEITEPGEKIMEVAAKSLEMGTTLWFTPTQLRGENNLPKTIIACGQFTMCFNLIEYFEKYINNIHYKEDYDKYNEETKQELDTLYQNLLQDWKKFKEDPYWMLNELHTKLDLQ